MKCILLKSAVQTSGSYSEEDRNQIEALLKSRGFVCNRGQLQDHYHIPYHYLVLTERWEGVDNFDSFAFELKNSQVWAVDSRGQYSRPICKGFKKFSEFLSKVKPVRISAEEEKYHKESYRIEALALRRGFIRLNHESTGSRVFYNAPDKWNIALVDLSIDFRRATWKMFGNIYALTKEGIGYHSFSTYMTNFVAEYAEKYEARDKLREDRKKKDEEEDRRGGTDKKGAYQPPHYSSLLKSAFQLDPNNPRHVEMMRMNDLLDRRGFTRSKYEEWEAPPSLSSKITGAVVETSGRWFVCGVKGRYSMEGKTYSDLSMYLTRLLSDENGDEFPILYDEDIF